MTATPIARVTQYHEAPDHLWAIANLLFEGGVSGFADYLDGTLNRWPGNPQALLALRHYDARLEADEPAQRALNEASRAFMLQLRTDTVNACIAAGFDVRQIPPLAPGRPNLLTPGEGEVFTYDYQPDAVGLASITVDHDRSYDPWYPGTNRQTIVRFRGPDSAVMTEEGLIGPLLWAMIDSHAFIQSNWIEGRVDL